MSAQAEKCVTTSSMAELIGDCPLIPTMVLYDAEDAVPLARALLAAGVRTMEIKLRSQSAADCIRRIASEVPEMVMGAGTVRSVADVYLAGNAGAHYCVSPGYFRDLGKACHEIGMALLPGAATPSEVLVARDDGYLDLKFFPAVQLGGVAMLQAWQGAFADIRFCASGGIHAGNAMDFLAQPNVNWVNGGWVTPTEAIASKNWSLIEALARDSLTALQPR